jgi:hypothetical protein
MPFLGSVSKAEMTTPMPLIYKALFSSISTFETPPDRERPHELSGLQARLVAKIALHNFCIWVNDQLGRPRLAFADLVAWEAHRISHQALQ